MHSFRTEKKKELSLVYSLKVCNFIYIVR